MDCREVPEWHIQELWEIKRSVEQDLAEIINTILDQVSTFANGQPQRDDVTLLVMRVQGVCDD
jgi:serine phosphatase RsbU (regulator of sigma subunit)